MHLQQVFHQAHLVLHEVFVECLADVAALAIVLDGGIQSVEGDHIGIAKVLVEEGGRVLLVFGDIVDIDPTGAIGDRIQHLVERFMEIPPIFIEFLVGCIERILLDLGSLLVIDQAEVVGILAHHRQSAEGMREAIANGHSLEAGQESLIILGLVGDLQADGGCVLPSVALSEDEERMLAADVDPLEAAIGVVVELLQGEVEIVGEVGLVGHVDIGEGGIGIGEACSYGLVDEDDVVILDPGVVVPDDLVGTLGGLGDPERPQFHEVAQLTGGSWSAIEPEYGGDGIDLASLESLLSVEDEAQGRAALVYLQVS